MLDKHYKALKYIKKHQPVTKKKLYGKFPFLEEEYDHISSYVSVDGYDEILDEKGRCTGEYQKTDVSIHFLNTCGQEFFEKKRRDFLHFALPYGITTVIATFSVVFQCLEFCYDHPEFVAKVISFFGVIIQWFQRLNQF